MNILGSVGQLYMLILLVILFLGSGLAIWRFIDFLIEKDILKQEAGEASKQNGQTRTIQKINQKNKLKGGSIMVNNSWIKLAVFSFVGIIVSVAVLGLVSANNAQGGDIHQIQQHQGMQQNNMGNMNMQGGMNVNTSMGNMQMQSNMNQDPTMMMQQQLYQMQMQLNQIQQQMGNMNGNMNSNMQMQQQGGMNNMSNMSSMPQNGGGSMSNMSSMPQNGGSSGGGMGMMGGMM